MTFKEGWYFFSKDTAHYFEQPNRPICNRKRRGTGGTFQVTTEKVSAIPRDKMTKWDGGCSACLKKIRQTKNETA